MNPNRKTLITLQNLLLLLSLILALPAPAVGQGPGDSNETLSTTAEQHMDPAATPEPIDCDKPLPGKVATLAEDDEILVVFAGQDRVMEIAKYDNTSNTDKNLKYFWTWQSDDNDEYDFYELRSWALTTADLDGDDKAEVVSAFCTDHAQELMAVSLKNPEASEKHIAYDFWSSSSHNRQGEELSCIDVAAGNLNGALGGDDADADEDADEDVVEEMFKIFKDKIEETEENE